MNADAAPLRRIVLVTGLSGAGKASVLRTLEDLGYEAVDNPPLPMLEEMVGRSDQRLAIGVDARTRGFDASQVLSVLSRLRSRADLRPELIYVSADETTLLRRYTESRRLHPLASQGVVSGRGSPPRRHCCRGCARKPTSSSIHQTGPSFRCVG